MLYLGRHNLAKNITIASNLKSQKDPIFTLNKPNQRNPPHIHNYTHKISTKHKKWLTTAAAVSSQLVSIPRITKSSFEASGVCKYDFGSLQLWRDKEDKDLGESMSE